ncbi:MAG TPA: hypothetical protein VGW38_23220 [Chloroflexota bacterium]|nr:hypothetical protein [Chloroflexota bacterium]
MSKFKPDASQSLGRRSRHQNPKADKVRAALQEEEKKRLHVHIPASLHQKLKLRAVTEERDMTELVTEALESYLGA